MKTYYWQEGDPQNTVTLDKPVEVVPARQQGGQQEVAGQAWGGEHEGKGDCWEVSVVRRQRSSDNSSGNWKSAQKLT